MKTAITLLIMALSTIAFGQEVNCTLIPDHPSCTASTSSDTDSSTTIVGTTNLPTDDEVEVVDIETTSFQALDSDPTDTSDSSTESDTSSILSEEESF